MFLLGVETPSPVLASETGDEHGPGCGLSVRPEAGMLKHPLSATFPIRNHFPSLLQIREASHFVSRRAQRELGGVSLWKLFNHVINRLISEFTQAMCLCLPIFLERHVKHRVSSILDR